MSLFPRLIGEEEEPPEESSAILLLASHCAEVKRDGRHPLQCFSPVFLDFMKGKRRQFNHQLLMPSAEVRQV